jgi:hypothetical protein
MVRNTVFRTRPRGSLRAAALLAVGVSPLFAGVASAATAPSVDGLEGVAGDAPELVTHPMGRNGEIASNRSVKLPTPVEAAGNVLPQAPQILDAAHALPGGSSLPSGERALPSTTSSTLPVVDQLNLQQIPVHQFPAGQRALPATSTLPVVDQFDLNQLPLNQLPGGKRALPSTSSLPVVDQLSLNRLPLNQLSSTDELPLSLNQLPVSLPGQG